MIIIYGTGFIGKHIVKVLNSMCIPYMCSKTRTFNYNEIKEEIDTYKPCAVINATGFPTPTNIDFYEDKVSKLVMTNTVGNLLLASICEDREIHYITIMSGCIFDGDIKFTDKSIPNFSGSCYSKNRMDTESILKDFKHTCIVRIRMPISSDMSPKSLITKLSNCENITNKKNSITVLDDCMPKIIDILKLRYTGVCNLVNQGTISNAYICYLYKKFINPSKNFKVVTPEEIHQVPRSNCILAPSDIVADTPNAKNSVYNIFIGLQRSMNTFC